MLQPYVFLASLLIPLQRLMLPIVKIGITAAAGASVISSGVIHR